MLLICLSCVVIIASHALLFSKQHFPEQRSMQIVVARYREDVSWLTQIQGAQSCIVYNKGDPLSIETPAQHVPLQNIGRETHTFLTHIIDNYDSLHQYKWIVFLQGNPFDHCKNATSKINSFVSEGTSFYGLSDLLLEYTLDGGCPFHPGLPLKSFYETMRASHSTLKDVQGSDSIRFDQGGQFIVTSSRILKHSKKFYIDARNHVDKEVNPIHAYVLERMWRVFFDD